MCDFPLVRLPMGGAVAPRSILTLGIDQVAIAGKAVLSRYT